MKKLSVIVAIIFLTSTISVTASAKPTAASLKQKVIAKTTVSEATKITKEFSKKVAELFEEIQVQHVYLHDLVTESEQISDEDKDTLIDLLENDPDYSWEQLNESYRKLMAKLPKNDLKALKILFAASIETYNDFLDNLYAFEEELPDYYTVENDSNYTNVDDGSTYDDGSNGDQNSSIDDDSSNDDSSVEEPDNGDN